MAKATGNEERYPLLLLYVEENGRKSDFPQRVVFADKGRGELLTRGAARVMAHWPAQVTSCWLTSIALGAAFILLSMLLLISSINPLSFPIHPRCTRDLQNHNWNKTIHLVKHGVSWDHKQLDLLRFIADTYPDFQIRTIILETSMKSFTTTTQKPLFRFHIPPVTNRLFKKWNEILRNHNEGSTTKVAVNITKVQNETRVKRDIRFYKIPTTYEEILKLYPNIQEERHTFKEYFANTPLRYFWLDYSSEMVIFSVRVLELWQNGGISFQVPCQHDYNTSNRIKNSTAKEVNFSQLKVLVAATKTRYENLSEDLVSIDGEGLHMATRIPCHSFFGEMIIKLQKDVFNMKISDFIGRILNNFCGRGGVDSEYCIKNNIQ